MSGNTLRIMKSSTPSLTLAGGLSLAVALFQAALAVSPSLSADFGAPAELVSNPPLLLIAGLVMAGVFAVCGLYGLAGAGHMRRLPLLRLGLLCIGGVYTLRGLPGVTLLMVVLNILPSSQAVPAQALASSLVALVIGLLYLLGTIAGWKRLSNLERNQREP